MPPPVAVAAQHHSFQGFQTGGAQSSSGSESDEDLTDPEKLKNDQSKRLRQWCKLRAVAIFAGKLAAERAGSSLHAGAGPSSLRSPAPNRKLVDKNRFKDQFDVPDDLEGLSNIDEPQPIGFFGRQVEIEQARKKANPSPSGETSADGDMTATNSVWNTVLEFRAKLWQIMDDPESGSLAYSVSMLILFLILISSVTFCLETMEEFSHLKPIIGTLDFICGASFTLEYFLKIASAPDPWGFFKAPLNLIDLIAILPFLTTAFMFLLSSASGGGQLSGTQILRVIRLVRVFRVLKLGGRFSKMQVVGVAVYDSMDMLGMLMFLLLLSMILFSTLIYFCESGLVDPDPFHSIPASFWWCIVTLMTVGYGDVVPASTLGQIVSSAAMLASIIILALPISVIGANFTQQWVIYKDNEKMKEQAEKLGPHFKDLVLTMTEHNSVMEELLSEIRIIESQMEKLMGRMRSQLDEVRIASESKKMYIAVQLFDRRDVEIEQVYAQATYLQAMLDERLKQVQLVQSEEFSNLLQLCASRHKKARLKIKDAKGLRLDVNQLNEDMVEVQALIRSAFIGGGGAEGGSGRHPDFNFS